MPDPVYRVALSLVHDCPQDDAGATVVKLCLDCRHHGTRSLAFPNTAGFQGPALLAFNDAKFSEADFASISRIGDSVKREQVGKTGRFGIGFNSVYHLTDLPSFVSGPFLAMFDPHCNFLPNANAASPGLRIDFTKNNVVASHYDQFNPFAAFGCDMRVPFDGTLFRFALRTAEQAAASRLSKQAHGVDDVRSMLRDFAREAVECLLFLKAVKRVEVYEWASLEICPALLFVTTVSCTPEAQIERNAFGRVSASAASGGTATSVYAADFKTEPHVSDIAPVSVTYLFSQALGGGRSYAVAQTGEQRYGMRLLPWASVAARVRGDPLEDGKAFCFLPLPVHTGLPVHINAYFELSSNRRDIWHGDDMAGGGALRSEWNTVLLTDVVAPAYARLLAEAPRRTGTPDATYALWPPSVPREPWGACVRATFTAMPPFCVVHTRRAGGQWIRPREALLPDHNVLASVLLQDACTAENLALVAALPSHLSEMLASYTGEDAPKLVTPDRLRSALCEQRPHPSTQTRDAALACLQYCLSDLELSSPAAASALTGVPLLMRTDGSMTAFDAAASRVFLMTELEHTLFGQRVPQLCLDRSIGDALLRQLQVIATAGHTNVRLVDAPALNELMVHILPASWRGKASVPWTPSDESGRTSVTKEVLITLWMRLGMCIDTLDATFAAWPLLPTHSGVLLPPIRGAPLVVSGLDDAITEALLAAGVHTLRPDVRMPSLAGYVFDSSTGGVVEALTAAQIPAASAFSATASCRRALAAYLLQPSYWGALTKANAETFRRQVSAIQALPIFETHADEDCFTTLATADVQYLAPAGVDVELLSNSYLRPPNADASQALAAHFGIARRSRAAFFREDATQPQRWASLSETLRQRVALAVLRDLPALCAEDSFFAAAMSEVAFVATPSGEFRRPNQLYDPRVPDLASLLDPLTCFPASPFDAPELVAPLVALGLRRSVTLAAVLDAARGVAAMAEKVDAEAATTRGSALLRYLDVELGRLLDPDMGKPLAGMLKSLGGLVNADVREKRMERDAARTAFLADLSAIAWCPVLTEPPEAGMPWTSEASCTAAPADVRPRGDAWLVSASARLLAVQPNISPGGLAQYMGWCDAPSARMLAAQLIALGTQHVSVTDTAIGQSLAGALPRVYTALSSHSAAADFHDTARTLRTMRCIWTGAGFAPPTDVAFTGLVTLAPYLHVLPADLACFRSLLSVLGVRDAFGPDDFRTVLRRLAADVGDSPLDASQLTMAVWILQRLAEAGAASTPAAAESMYVPDTAGVLRLASSVAFNDAPWLGTPDADVVLAHPLLSHSVAEAAGVCSMRRILLAESAAAVELGLAGASAEAFGQSEALTTRLRHIIDSYADGPGIFMELVQNADDAGAGHVAFLLDEGHYGTQSLLGGKMADWQGPALLCYNDKLFAPSDFAAISRIGQDSKVDKPAAAGRFGLGFNAVYHWTDIPSFVSGEYLVYFDPHANILPGTSAAHPGMKINFASTGGRLLRQFPDQFAPLLQFGNTMATSFNGTLFRFPLRTQDTAARSDIKSEPYPPSALRDLLQAFQEGVCRTLLFLKHVRRISVYLRSDGDQEPRLWYEASLDTPDGDPRQPAVSFAKAGGGKKQFNTVLARTPEAQLPVGIGRVRVSLLLGDGEESTPELARTESWLLCSTIGGGRARTMATGDVSGRGLVPWAGVAALLPDEASAVDAALRGRAFCFLPLPVHTGLPVHINAYFELSSNRRDIWHGDDMAGGGALRSEWNTVLLTDVVAPAYARLLAEAASLLGATRAFFSLFPPDSDAIAEPWRTALVQRVYYCLATLPVLPSASAPGQWLCPNKAILQDHTPAGLNPDLQTALAAEGLPLASIVVPARICNAFSGSGAAGLRVLTPSLVRDVLRADKVPHPCLKLRDAALAALEYCLSDILDDEADSVKSLIGVPLIPLANGDWQRFAHLSMQRSVVVYVPTDEHTARLLTSIAPDRVVVRVASPPLLARFQALAGTGVLNVALVTPPALAALMPKILPSAWRGAGHIAWTPGEDGPSDDTFRLLWRCLAQHCETLEQFAAWPLLPTSTPGAGDATPTVLVPPQPSSCVVAQAGWSDTLQAGAYAAGARMLTVGFSEVEAHPYVRAHCIHDATPAGVLTALLHSTGWPHARQAPSNLCAVMQQRFGTAVCDAERTELRGFLLQSKWHSIQKPLLSDAHLAILSALPIFETFAQQDSSLSTRFVALADGVQRALPPLDLDLDASLFDDTIIKAGSAREAAVLATSCGLMPAPRAVFLRSHVLNATATISPAVRNHTFSALITRLADLQAEDSGFVDMLADTAFVPVAGGAAGGVAKPGRLYDPRVVTIATMLQGTPAFPAAPFDTPDMLDALLRLGLRRTLGAQGVLDAAAGAHLVSTQQGSEAGAARGAALLKYLGSLADVDDAAAGAPDADAFWQSLRAAAWCPVQTEAPDAALPWPSGATTLSRLAPPRVTRSSADAWLVSAQCRLLDADLSVSSELSARLGWSAAPAASVLAAQVLELSKRHAAAEAEAAAETLALQPEEDAAADGPRFAPAVPALTALATLNAALDASMPKLYAALATHARQQDVQIVKTMLDGAPCIWVSTGVTSNGSDNSVFVAATLVAFDALPAYAPYLFPPPACIAEHRQLLLSLGAIDVLACDHMCSALRRVAAEYGEEAVPEDVLSLAAEFAERAADGLSPGAKPPVGVYLPDAHGVMAPAAELLFNDASWLAPTDGSTEGTHLRLVHPSVPLPAAERLGAKSLRLMFLVDQKQTDRLPCPPAASIATLLSGYQDVDCLLWDLLEVADAAGATSVEVTLDARQHGRQSLLAPLLAPFQGPALMVRFGGVSLDSQELCSLLAPAPPIKLRGRVCRFGNGLLSAFHITDLPCALSGGQLYMFDPTGSILGTAAAGSKSASQSPLGKAYTYVNSDLPRRFSDQFAPFEEACDLSRPCGSTLLRLPIRAATASALGQPQRSVADIEELLCDAVPCSETALLFAASLTRLKLRVWRADEPAPSEALLDVAVTQCDAEARALCDDKDWKKTGLLNFISGTPATKRTAGVTLTHRRGSSPAVVDEYIVCGTIGGSGKARDTALDRKRLAHMLLPYAAAAVHIARDGDAPPPFYTERTSLFAPLPLQLEASGLNHLPLALMACFELTRAGGRRLHPLTSPLTVANGNAGAVPPAVLEHQQKAAWNRDMLVVAATAVADVLTETARVCATRATAAQQWQYTVWPRRTALSGSPDSEIMNHSFFGPLYTALAERPVLRLRSGAAVRAVDALFLPDGGDDAALPGGGARAVAFLAAHHPVVSAPPGLRAEFLAAGIAGVRELTPTAIRKLLRSTAPPSGMVSDELVETHIELLGCCFADLIAPPSADASTATPVTAAAAALGAAPGGAMSTMAALLDENGMIDANTLRAVADHLPGPLRETAEEMLIASGLGGTTRGEGGPSAAVRPAEHPPLHTMRLRELHGVPFPTVDGRLVPFNNSEVLIAPLSATMLFSLNPAACKGRVAHTRCVEAHGRFFLHPGFQTALKLAPATLARLAPVIRDMLPRQYVIPTGGDVVPWQGGDAALPSRVWIRDLWTHIEAAVEQEIRQGGPSVNSDLCLDVFAPLALLPLRSEKLCRVGMRKMVLVPPGPWRDAADRRDGAGIASWREVFNIVLPIAADAARMEDAVANMQQGDAVSTRCPTLTELWPTAEAIAVKMGAPILDVTCLPTGAARLLLGRHHTGAEELLSCLSVAIRAGTADIGRTGPEDRDALLAMVASSRFHVSHRGWLASPEATLVLRTLPLFRLARGGHTVLDSHLGEQSMRFVTITTPDCHLLVTTALGTVPELLAPPDSQEMTRLYTTLGVPMLSDGDLLARMVLPRFSDLSRDNKAGVLGHVLGNWSRLREQPEVVAVLRTTRFVHASTPDGAEKQQHDDDDARLLRSPEELLDPECAFLAAAFAEQSVFPSRRWRTPAWLSLLRAAGLSQGLDAPALVKQAQRLQSAWVNAEDAHAGARSIEEQASTEADLRKTLTAAEALVAHLFQQAGKYTPAECTQLASIAFVPALRPGLPGGAAVAATGAATTLCMARLSECALPEHWPLAWAHAPTLLSQCTPPPAGGLRARLGVRSPPSFATFVAHLHACAGIDAGESLLSAWPMLAGPPETAFGTAMAHLAELWPTLSPQEIARIKGAAFVPVGNASRLVAPEALFFRCPVDLAPLAYEVPPKFACHADMLRGLGARDMPQPGDIAAILRAAAARMSGPSRPLGPNELQAALRCVVVLADSLHQDPTVPIPDASGALTVAQDCVRLAGTKPSTRRWAMQAVGSGALRLRFVHPQLETTPRMCAALGVPSLDAVVTERVTSPEDVSAAEMAALEGPGGVPLSLSRVAARIAAPEFQAAAHAVAVAGTGTSMSCEDVAASFTAAAGRLVFVPRIRVLIHTGADSVEGAEASRPFFDDPVSGKLLIAQPEGHLSPAEMIVAALSDVLRLPAPLPLAHLLTCPDDSLPAVARDMCDTCVVSTARDASSTADCMPGHAVIPAHEALVQCKPLRPFCAGELCAWRPPAAVVPPAEAARAAALARAAGRQATVHQQAPLRYVRVVSDASVGNNAVLHNVVVEIAPGETRTLLSTDLLSFRSTGGDGCDNHDESRGGGADAVSSEATPSNAPAQMNGSIAPQAAVSATDAARAVRDLLAAANLPLDLDKEEMLRQTLDMQAKLKLAESQASEAQRAAAIATAEAEAVSRTLTCPIMQSLMTDPVMCSDGHTYERAAIVRWFASGSSTSPVTNRQLSDRTLVPNHAVKSAIAALLERQRAAGASAR